jgi:phosphatidylglycerophosphate synthase
MLTAWHDLPLIRPWLTLDVLGTAVIVVTTIWSGVEYFIKNWDVFSR